ncbi:hypothetical protein SapgrDRAFT_0180 [Saprospira grandis DSM 2844]|uniref:DUF4296 domain-containing protein n=1 Tax=Saprospira grandis DSM 2844 TaxID=694433 RepID=J0NWQ8_9BACT|nr:DUF4296 domain-containing protein [Saprospira grandis]EJF51939.1 hypothetical protein SapgrDRAFT_0180 [Saprospira grandis DSM 2844]
MLKVIIYSSCLFLLLACYRPLETEAPILGEQEIIPFLVDLHLAEAKVAEYNSLTVLAKDSLAAEQYATLFQIHQIEPTDFQQSMQAYMGNPEALQQLYEKVVEALLEHELKHSERSKKGKKRSAAEALEQVEVVRDSSKKEN